MAREQVSQNEFTAQAIAEATRVAIQTMATTDMARQENPGTKMNRPNSQHPLGEQRTGNLGQTERVSVIKNWLGSIATQTKEEEDMCNDKKGLFKSLDKKIKHNLMEQ